MRPTISRKLKHALPSGDGPEFSYPIRDSMDNSFACGWSRDVSRCTSSPARPPGAELARPAPRDRAGCLRHLPCRRLAI